MPTVAVNTTYSNTSIGNNPTVIPARAAATVRPSRKVRRRRRSSALAASRPTRHPDSHSTTPQPAPATAAPPSTITDTIDESVHAGWNDVATMYGRDVHHHQDQPDDQTCNPEDPALSPHPPIVSPEGAQIRQPRPPVVPQDMCDPPDPLRAGIVESGSPGYLAPLPGTPPRHRCADNRPPPRIVIPTGS
ncbi:hypothetical protein [Rhodococcus jostii]|uniref:hypothetical protein n=1 Tax=Rhodococcus jostii TaxID=132919 RepID=UPI00115F89C0|nr:hypothetical protein [Rhodococcus jostii]